MPKIGTREEDPPRLPPRMAPQPRTLAGPYSAAGSGTRRWGTKGQARCGDFLGPEAVASGTTGTKVGWGLLRLWKTSRDQGGALSDSMMGK